MIQLHVNINQRVFYIVNVSGHGQNELQAESRFHNAIIAFLVPFNEKSTLQAFVWELNTLVLIY